LEIAAKMNLTKKKQADYRPKKADFCPKQGEFYPGQCGDFSNTIENQRFFIN
jgi:hypothetical protein